MLVYVDGTALSRYAVDLPESPQWRAWAGAHESSLVTSPLGISELRRLSFWLDHAGRTRTYEVTERIAVVRFSDQTIATAAMALAVLSPFASLHLGIAVSNPEVSTMATYDQVLARVAIIFGLQVVSPGRRDRWWEE